MPFAVYRFGEFSLDCGKFELCRKERRLKLERKPLELLVLLVTKHGQVVTREEISARLWEQEVFVDIEHGINTAIRKIRQALGDSPDLPQYVQTISGSGYRFVAPVTAVEPEVPIEDFPSSQGVAPSQPIASVPEIVTAPEEYVAREGSAGPDRLLAKPQHRLWIVVAITVAVVMTISVLNLGPRPLAARFLHRDSHSAIGSIAVLPLQNLSGDPGQEYFADGMTDELITELARIPNLRVVSRTSVMANKGSGRSLPDIARQLDVDAIVEGSIVRSGDRIRITAQLIDARTDRHLWAQSFEGSASDVLSLQDSVAQQIAAQASVVLAPPSPRAPVNAAAHDAYLRGRYFLNKQDFARSLESFKDAIDLDPNYASAHAGYASALDAVTTYGIGTPRELMPKAIAEAQRAIQLDPQNGEAYTELGSVQTIYLYDWTAAEKNLTRGISLNPSDSIAEFKYAIYLDAVGRPQDAVTHMRRALQLDPLSFLVNRRLGVALYYDRQYDAAVAQLQRASEMERSPESIDHYLSLIYEQKGDHDEAVQHNVEALRENESKVDIAALLKVYRQQGWRPFWRARTRALPQSTNSCNAYEIGLDDLRVNELDHAFASFQRASEIHCFSMPFIRVDPLFDSVRQDPRYAALLARMNQ
ncbi:winged helix-turn-helix domain-containing protein [Telmatobacter sp. DSM 110680]|uniref:Winged helix-turn-helix domain-containing protein n=1 Tax=Telmatobacter sp. DSM 110680 TaxID=3036704 RepID=A0AAU7DFU7_9BACT